MATYQRPSWFTKNVANAVILLLVRLGLKPGGAHLLAVRGRKSGEWRTVPVNPLELDGARYLVAPRGETEWVRNIRAAGEAELRSGSKTEPFKAVELNDSEKPAVLREYLRRWGGVTAAYFDATADASDEEFRRIAPDHPSFRIIVDA